MRGKTNAVDRLLLIVLGLALVAIAVLAVLWQIGMSWLPDTLSTTQVQDVLTQSWWPWALGAASVLLILLGLWLLLGHVPKRGPGTVRLSPSGPGGRVEADLRSVASAVAGDFESRAPVHGVDATTERLNGVALVEVRGRLDRDADVESVMAAAENAQRNVRAAFPDDAVQCRILLRGPGRERRRGGAIRVQTESSNVS